MIDPKNIKRKHKNILEDDLVQRPRKVDASKNTKNVNTTAPQTPVPNIQNQGIQSKNRQLSNTRQAPKNNIQTAQTGVNGQQPVNNKQIPDQVSKKLIKKQNNLKNEPINRVNPKNSNGQSGATNDIVEAKQPQKNNKIIPIGKKPVKNIKKRLNNKKNTIENTIDTNQPPVMRQRRRGYNKNTLEDTGTTQVEGKSSKNGLNLSRNTNIKPNKWMGLLIGLVVFVILVVFYFTGIFSKIFTPGDNPIDSIRYTFMRGQSFPVDFQVPGYKQAVALGDNGIALVGAQDMEILAKNGKELQKVQHGYTSPGIVAGSTRVVLYSYNGTKLQVFNRSEGIGEIDTKQTIKRVQMNKNNWITAITDSDVRIYKSSLAEEWRWKIADETPISAVLNDENKLIAIGSVKATGGILGTNIELFQTNKTDSVGKIVVDNAVLVKMEFLSSGKLMVFYDTYTAIYSSKGEELHRFDYNDRQLVMCEVKGQKTVLLFGDNLQESTTVFILDAQLGTLGQTNIESSVQGLAIVGSTNYILGDSTVYIYNDKGELKSTKSSNDRIKTMISSGSKVFLIATDKIYEVNDGRGLTTSSK